MRILAGLAVLLCFNCLRAAETPAPTPPAATATPPAPTTRGMEGDADAISAVRLWEQFVAYLRAGKMRNAHECFSETSRQSLPYLSFCSRYSPVTAASEIILSDNSRKSWSFSDNKAELRFIASETNALVKVFLVRENGAWFLVTDATRNLEETEADARMLLLNLRMMILDRSEQGVFKGSFKNFRTDYAAVVKSYLWRSVEKLYYIKAVSGADKPWRIELYPKDRTGTLRAYRISEDLEVPDAFVPAPVKSGRN